MRAQPVLSDLSTYTLARQRYAIFLLFVVYTLNFLDRQIINILAEPIKQDLGISDGQLGVLTGLGFVLFYSAMSIPIARLAERYDRPMVIATSLAVWSGFTAISGFAQSFIHLLLARIGVGIGEAGCSPPAHSLICDIVPEERRATALANFSMGAPVGALLGLAIGGLLAGAIGWRAAFLVVGLPGILIAVVLVATLKDPRRALGVTAAKASSIPLRSAMAELRRNRTFWFTIIGSGLIGLVSIGHAAFYGSFYLRNHADELAILAGRVGLEPLGLLGLALGLSYGISAAAGTYLSGRLADSAAKQHKRGYIKVAAIGPIIGSPLYVAAMLVDGFIPSLAFLGAAAMFNGFYQGPTIAIVQSVVHARMRATASALMMLVVSLIAFGIGPVSVGLLSDWLAGPRGLGPAEGIRWAQVLSTAVVVPALFLYWRAWRAMPDDLK